MANARFSSNSKRPLLSSEEQPAHEDTVSRGEVIIDNGTAVGLMIRSSSLRSPLVSKARPPSPDREIELALGGNYVHRDEAAYGATNEMGTVLV